MTQYTPKGWPYAGDGEPMIGWPDTSEELATLLNGDEAVITWAANYGPNASDPLRIVKRGPLLFVSGGFQNTANIVYTINQQITIGTVAAAFRPPTGREWRIAGTQNLSGVGFYVSQLFLRSDGAILWQPSQTRSTNAGPGVVNATYHGIKELL